MTKVQGALATLVAATALAACGGPGPTSTGAGPRAAVPGGVAAPREATRLGLLTAPAVCPPTCNAAEGRARFGEQEGTDGFSFRVVDSTTGDTGEVALNIEDSPFGAYTTEGTPIDVVIVGTSIQVSGTFHGPFNETFASFSFTLDTATGGVRNLTLDGSPNALFNEFVIHYPGACEVPSS